MTMQKFTDDLTAYLQGRLKAGLDARTYAIGLIRERDLSLGHFEVRGFHTASGNPLPIGFEPATFNDEGDMIEPPRL